MLAHYHGQVFNASEMGSSLNTTGKTIRHYLDILVGTFMVRRLSPWHENLGKRQVKSPKIYFQDSGILHSLLGIVDEAALHLHPKLGASWEGFAVEEIIRAYHAREEEVYFWAVHGQGELDLLILKNGKRLGFEIKYSESPRITKWHHELIDHLKLDELNVVCPEAGLSPITDRIRILGLKESLLAASAPKQN